MTELERALVALGNELDFPATPDVWSRVEPRLQRRRWVRPAVFAAAVVAVAIGIAMAVPPARSAILKFFHIGAATVEQVETLPPAQTQPFAYGLGPPRSRATVDLPASVTPLHYYAQHGLRAALVRYRGKQLLFARLEGDQMGFSKKFTDPTTHVEDARIGEWGIFFSGGMHVIRWQFGAVPTRLAGNVLLWLDRGVTYRLEGPLDKSQMLRLGRQITR
jgi:hypothetical protein